MPQKTNLNISPYYDDFNKDKQFYKVLFRPGYPVQARELTTLQSTLQNQVESFGSHMFKEGSMVIPGNIAFDNQYYSIKLLSDHLGLPVTLYLENLKGKRLRGQNSGVVVYVEDCRLPSDSNDITDVTLFIKYVTSGTNNEAGSLEDGENLLTEESFVYGNTPVNAGDSVATLIPLDSSYVGSAVGISSGVYFIRGSFVDVASDKIILDPYSNTPSYRVGLTIQEEIIGAKDDESLYDNARGFSNFAAPGADRLRISTILSKKNLDDYNDKSFVEILKLDLGEVKKIKTPTEYNIVKDYFAKRTFEESGNYSINNFKVEASNSLNDGVSQEGVFLSSQVTDDGNTPNDDLMCVKISAGKAYVKGYDISKSGTTVLDIEKPRDKQTNEGALIPFEMGTRLKINNVYGAPKISIKEESIIKLQRHRRVGGITNAGSGELIGEARAYAFNLADQPYSNNASTWDLYLYDLQTYTKLTLNKSINSNLLPNTSYVKGLNSGATGYVTGFATGSVVTLTQTSGAFLKGEQISINGSTQHSRAIQSFETFGVKDIKSVYQDSSSFSGFSADFIGDVVLQTETLPGFNVTDVFQFSAPDGPTSQTTVTCPGKKFTGIATGSIIGYTQTGSSFADESLNRVVSVDSTGNSIQITGISTVVGVCTGGLPTSAVNTTLSLKVPTVNDSEKSGLFAPLPDVNISDVNLSGSNLLVSKQLTGESTDGNGDMTFSLADSGISTGFYETYDPARYSVHRSNGAIETLSSDQFSITNNVVTLKGLTTNQSNIVVSSTIKKIGIKSKQKEFIRSNKVTVDKVVGSAATTISGLSTSNFYGLRIEDEEISLNVPDVVEIVAVYESLDSSAPVLDKLTFVSGLSLNTSSILGERVRGAESGAVAQLATQSSATEIEIVYLTQNKFQIGESITFEESNIVTNLQDITEGSFLNISNKYELDKGQKLQYYDYSKIVRKTGLPAPARQLLIIHNSYQVPANDDGDVYTVDSYPQERFTKDVPILPNGKRASDVLDFRPRVASFNASTATASPFGYASRNFNQGFNPPLVVSPNESSFIGYSFYLPRIDKLVLTSKGDFSLIKGISSTEPKEPSGSEDSMNIGTIKLPAYLYDPKDAVITTVDNRRYTMRDIGKIEDRVENLETLTSLSILELSTKTLQVQDSNGFDRFKTGFFVDDFADNTFLDISDPDCKVDVDRNLQELNTPINLYTLKPELGLEPSINTDTADFSSNLALLDSNLKKTGDLITLDYEEVELLNQPLASRIENVNPFNIVVFSGRITLNPQSDNWVRNIVVQGEERTVLGDAEGTVVNEVRISSIPDTHIRSRNVAFDAHGLKPFTRFYSFFDSTGGIDVIPKLLEINMTNGVFTKGETVDVFAGSIQLASFRICQPNHKSGDTNTPSTIYTANPYDRDVTIQTSYSASSTILNIDIDSLAEEAQGRFSGYVRTGNDVVIVGRTSNAQASVSSGSGIRLVSDIFGDVKGSFFFRDPLADPVPPLRFTNGSKTFRLTSSSNNSISGLGEVSITSAEAVYTTSGVVDTFEQSTTVVRIPPPPPIPIVINNTFVTQEITEITNITQEITEVTNNITNVTRNITNVTQVRNRDPLAQTFIIDETGAFLTSIDLYFKKKDSQEKIDVQIRTTELGTPTDLLVQDYAEVTLEPSEIKVSDDASIPTRVNFPAPIYLQEGETFAVVLLAETSNNYEAWISRMGEINISANALPDTENVVISKQYLGGSLFKSQNGSIWTANQFEDLKFTLYKAKFVESGTLTLFNPKLGSNSNLLPRLLPNSIKTLPRKLKVGITTITNNPIKSNFTPGVKVSDSGTAGAVNGIIEQVGGPIATSNSGITLTSSGTGYANGSYLVDLFPITGNGSRARCQITVAADGKLTAATMNVANTIAGEGYVEGDLLGITTSSTSSGKGSEATITVGAINGLDTLYLTNCQGRQFTDGQDLHFYVGGTAVGLANTDIRGDSTVINDLFSGNVIEVEHYNHGMGADNNIVQLDNIEPDTVPIKLTGDINSTTVTTISVANTSTFTTYEGITTSIGYVKINNEIIKYDGVGSGTLSIDTRGVTSTSRTHSKGDIVQKYELNGISLVGINTTHQMATQSSVVNNAKDINKYYVEVLRKGRIGLDSDRDETASPNNDDNLLCFTDEKSVGGNRIFASQNIQYNSILPRFNFITPGNNTSLASRIRTVSATSASGSEVSFVDQGYEPVELNQINKLSSTRMVCSEVNESEHLKSLPKNRSFTTQIDFKSSDFNLSPIIDTQNAVMIYIRNMLNSPINDYSLDSSSNEVSGDPHAAVYISNRVDLQQPATSLKVIVGAFRHSSADFRVLYQLFKTDSKEVEPKYELFPGYENLVDSDGDGFGDTVIDPVKNNGRPDAIVPASTDDEFLDYQFSVDNLNKFNGFKIKIVISGTNEAHAPKFQDIRAIALA